jgi:sugar lactone lactonase YvrE
MRIATAYFMAVASTASAGPVETLVRPHLEDLELRTCLTTSMRDEHVIRVETRSDHGQSYYAATALTDTDDLANCFNGLLARWTLAPVVQTEPVTFVLTVEPHRAAIDFELVRDEPRATAAAVPIELVAGAPGGRGAHDGAARDARFAIPLGIAADGAGHLFVGEADDHAIRRVDLADGHTRTEVIVPQTETRIVDGELRTLESQNLRQPSSLAADAHGSIFALDTLTDEIWRVDRGKLGRVWEVPIRSFDTPRALAGARAMVFDRDGTLLVADSENQRIVRIDLATKALTPVAGTYGKAGCRDGKDALFDDPEGLAVDDAGHLFVAEWANHTIREITLATGETRTLAGKHGDRGHADGIGAAARFDAPASLVWDRGALYVAESGGQKIRKVDVASRRVTTLRARFGHHVSSALGELPPGFAMAGGILYLADSGNHTILAIDPATGTTKTLAGVAPPDVTPRAVALAGEQVYVTAGEALYRLGPSGPRELAGDRAAMGHRDGRGAAARFYGPIELGALPDGTLIVGEIDGEIRRVDPKTGVVKTITDFKNILEGMTVDRRGTIYASLYGSILRVGLKGTSEVVVTASAKDHPGAIVAPISEVQAMAADGDMLYVLDHRRSTLAFYGTILTLRAFDLRTHTAERLATWTIPKTGLDWALAQLAFDGNTLWLTHPNGAITIFDPRTRSERVVIAPAPHARGVVLGDHPEVNTPSYPILDADGNLLVIDEGAVLRVVRPAASHQRNTTAGPGV